MGDDYLGLDSPATPDTTVGLKGLEFSGGTGRKPGVPSGNTKMIFTGITFNAAVFFLYINPTPDPT